MEAKKYSCIEDSDDMEKFQNKDGDMNGYAYHVTSNDCCGKTEQDMCLINWPPVDELPSDGSGNQNENNSGPEDLANKITKMTLKDEIKAFPIKKDEIKAFPIKKDEIKAFPIKNSVYHPAVEGVDGMYMSTTLYDDHLPGRTVYPFGKGGCGKHYYQRISINFDKIHEKYPLCKFWCKKNKQLHYICHDQNSENFINTDQRGSDDIKFFEDFNDSELESFGIIKEGETKDILPRLQNDYNSTSYFNNIVLLGGIEIPEDKKIDIVRKEGPKNQ